MDFATILGVVSAFSLVLAAITTGGGVLVFWNLPSLLIVVGGTFGATLINYPLGEFASLLSYLKNALTRNLVEVEGYNLAAEESIIISVFDWK